MFVCVERSDDNDDDDDDDDTVLNPDDGCRRATCAADCPAAFAASIALFILAVNRGLGR